MKERDRPEKIMIKSTLEETEPIPSLYKSPDSVITLKKTKSSLSPKVLDFEHIQCQEFPLAQTDRFQHRINLFYVGKNGSSQQLHFENPSIVTPIQMSYDPKQ